MKKHLFQLHWHLIFSLALKLGHLRNQYLIYLYSLEEFLGLNGTTKLSELELERLHIKHEGWEEYEARWLPGTCPQVSHIVILTWVVTPYTLPEHAYQRLRALIEDGAEVRDKHLYHQEPDKIRHYFPPYKWDGKFAFHSSDSLVIFNFHQLAKRHLNN